MASQPDLVVISQEGLNALGGEENLWKLPGLAQTPAGRSKQVLAIDDMACWWLQRPHAESHTQLRARAEQLPDVPGASRYRYGFWRGRLPS